MLHFAYAQRSVQHDKCGVIPSALFLSFRARARNPVWMLRYACAPFSMTSAVSFQVLFFVIPSALFLSFRARARNPVWMLHFAYAPFSMTSVVSFRALFFVIPSESEESSAMWMLHFAYAQRSVQHDKCGVIPSAFFCHSERSFLSFRARARNPVWMLHFAYALFSMTSAVSFQVLFFVIPSALFCHSERERGIPCDVDASLRSA